MKYLIILLAVAFLLAACTSLQPRDLDDPQKTPPKYEQTKKDREEVPTPTKDPEEIFAEEVQNNLYIKLEALKDKDLERYLSTISRENQYFFNEQGRWFAEMIKEGMENISFELIAVELKDEHTGIATIRQKHYHNEQFDITYPLSYRYKNGQWLDCGYNFDFIETDRYTLKYMEGEARVDEFRKMIDIAYNNLEDIFTERADPNFEIKLFCDREMLRQRTVPSISWLFTGWGEPNESLKIYTGHETFEGYNGTLQHELVHHITIKICNNNLPVWVLEGVAMYYGNAYFDHSKSTTLSNLKKENIDLSIDYLENMDLYNPKSQQHIWDWYNASYMYVRYLIEKYGHDQFMQLFYKAGEKPFHDSIMNDRFEAKNIQTMNEVLSSVFNITKEELGERYLKWLETTDCFENAA